LIRPRLAPILDAVHTGALETEIAELYRDVASGLFRYASVLARNRETAWDAVQEAYLRYFIARRGGRQIHDPKAWLFRVLRNVLLDVLKRHHVQKEVAIEQARESADLRPDPECEFGELELSRQTWESLAPREQECLKLRAEGLRYEEIAGVLGIRSGTVGALLARAQRKIRRAFRGSARRAPAPAARLCVIAEASPYAH
jgi:RNA polymerase sigma-70 factor (ECF subfamily)